MNGVYEQVGGPPKGLGLRGLLVGGEPVSYMNHMTGWWMGMVDVTERGYNLITITLKHSHPPSREGIIIIGV